MDINFKEILESDAYRMQKDVLFKEINANRLDIDYSVFKKTDEEKAKLATMKAAYKRMKCV